MSGKVPHSNPFLVFLTICICLLFGLILTKSSSDLTEISLSEQGSTSSDTHSTVQETEDSSQTENTQIEKDPASSSFSVSKEASIGKWVPDEAKWYFKVDGVAFTGWLHDTDGKSYYFNKNGVMMTGWVNHNGNRYYMDEDGIMQTGKIHIDGKVYLFSDTGIMEGYAEPTPAPTPIPSPTPIPLKKADPLPNGKKPAVAITFDDGPGIYADRILDCLEKNHAKATFFMIGSQISSYPEQVKRMDSLGCEIGNHSYNHENLSTLTQEEITNTIEQTNQELIAILGHGATVIRPPYGSVTDSVLATLNEPVILWSIDTLDWSTRNPVSTIESTLSNVTDGSIILMHEIYEESAEAAEYLIPKLIEAGYDLLTIQELAERHETKLMPNTAYRYFEY